MQLYRAQFNGVEADGEVARAGESGSKGKEEGYKQGWWKQ